jgi:hypothetical protein
LSYGPASRRRVDEHVYAWNFADLPREYILPSKRPMQGHPVYVVFVGCLSILENNNLDPQPITKGVTSLGSGVQPVLTISLGQPR